MTEVDHEGGDVTVDAGGHIVDLIGNVTEFAVDTFANYASNCWRGAPLGDPSCRSKYGNERVATRGTGWGTTAIENLLATFRLSAPFDGYTPETGFRCVRPGFQ